MVNNSEDIRAFLTTGSRSKVPPRNARLLGKQPATAAPRCESENPQPEATPEPPAQDFAGTRAELEKLPTVGKRLAVHLEQGVRADLVRLCDEAEVTPETWIEAACAYCTSHPDLMEEIIADAKVRLKQRKQAGLIRRTRTMAQKYRGSD